MRTAKHAEVHLATYRGRKRTFRSNPLCVHAGDDGFIGTYRKTTAACTPVTIACKPVKICVLDRDDCLSRTYKNNLAACFPMTICVLDRDDVRACE